MFFLVGDVRLERRHVRRADRERTVASLPMKTAEAGTVVFDPFRRLLLQVADECGNGDGGSQPAKRMDMVFNAANCQRGGIQTFASAAKVTMESIAQCLTFQKRSSLFRGKHNVHVDLNQGLRHGRADGETLSGFGAIDNPKPRVRVATLGFVVKRRCRFALTSAGDCTRRARKLERRQKLASQIVHP